MNTPSPSAVFRATAGCCLSTALIAGQALFPQFAAAESPGTLMRWNYGDGGDGGPNQYEPLITDRPDFTESPGAVGLHVVQIEAGYTYTYDSDATRSVKSHAFPETLFRIGVLADWLELRIAWNYNEQTTLPNAGGSSLASGSDDLGLGLKFALTGQEGILPATGVIVSMFVPTGSGGFSANETLPSVNFVYGWELTDCISLAGETMGSRALDDSTNRPYLEMAQSFSFGFSLTDRLGSYTEWFVFAPDGADTNRTQHYFDSGFSYLVNNNLQVDIRGGVGLNEAADDYFFGSGFAIRL